MQFQLTEVTTDGMYYKIWGTITPTLELNRIWNDFAPHVVRTVYDNSHAIGMGMFHYQHDSVVHTFKGIPNDGGCP